MLLRRFDSIDGEPVRFIFMLIGKENLLNTHIKLLSRISRLMNKDEFREKLLEAVSPEEVLSIFKEEEKNYFDI
jgi:mannitol/fructose-specific phosphotransferase system IIA component (Ntr-type)